MKIKFLLTCYALATLSISILLISNPALGQEVVGAESMIGVPGTCAEIAPGDYGEYKVLNGTLHSCIVQDKNGETVNDYKGTDPGTVIKWKSGKTLIFDTKSDTFIITLKKKKRSKVH